MQLAEGVELSIEKNNLVKAKGSKGELSLKVDPNLTVEKNDNEVLVKRTSDHRKVRALHGLYRVLLQNMVTGVTEGFKKVLEVRGVGFRAALNGDVLELALGYSHPYYFVPPPGIDLQVDTKSAKNPRVIISGIDKELVGQVAAKIRSLRPPEPYKGKGVRYLDEDVRIKAGKSASR